MGLSCRVLEGGSIGKVPLSPFCRIDTSISPDDQTAITTFRHGEIVAMDLRSGRIKRIEERLDGAGTRTTSNPGTDWPHVAGWLENNVVCVQFRDSGSPGSRHDLLQWNVDTGDLKRLCSIPIHVPKSAQDNGKRSNRFYLIPGSKPPMTCDIDGGYVEYGYPAPSV